MKFSISREQLLRPLQLVAGIIEKRQAWPILSNVLLRVNNKLTIIGTDHEIELVTNLPLENYINGEVTVSGRKLVDICRALPEGASIHLTADDNKMLIQSGKSRFSLGTLPACDYPNLEQTEAVLEFSIEQSKMRFLLQRTCFSMAQQDVRYYLNGMLLEVKQGMIRTVATDGHRLALNSAEAAMTHNALARIIIPRKGVIELLKLLDPSEEEAMVSIMTNHIRIANDSFIFTSKLIEGQFPDYERVLPKNANGKIALSRELLKEALIRVSIVCHEKLRGIQLQLRQGLLRILGNNPECEQAEEEISLNYYSQDNLDIGFNVRYLLDILDTLEDDLILMTFSDSASSVLINGNKSEDNSLFVVMPMRL